MKRVIYSLYVDVPEKEHYGPSKFKYDTLEKAKETRNSFKDNYKSNVFLCGGYMSDSSIEGAVLSSNKLVV